MKMQSLIFKLFQAFIVVTIACGPNLRATILPSNASQVQAFAGALYGIQAGSTTMTQVKDNISASGLNNVLNAFYSNAFGSQNNIDVATIITSNLGLTGDAATTAAAHITNMLNASTPSARGVAVNNILNLFASLTTDPTYGAAATAWNAKVANAVSYASNPANTANVTFGSALTKTIGDSTYTLNNGAYTRTDAAGNTLTLNSDSTVTTTVGGVRYSSTDGTTFTGTDSAGNTLTLNTNNNTNTITTRVGEVTYSSTNGKTFTGTDSAGNVLTLNTNNNTNTITTRVGGVTYTQTSSGAFLNRDASSGVSWLVVAHEANFISIGSGDFTKTDAAGNVLILNSDNTVTTTVGGVRYSSTDGKTFTGTNAAGDTLTLKVVGGVRYSSTDGKTFTGTNAAGDTLTLKVTETGDTVSAPITNNSFQTNSSLKDETLDQLKIKQTNINTLIAQATFDIEPADLAVLHTALVDVNQQIVNILNTTPSSTLAPDQAAQLTNDLGIANTNLDNAKTALQNLGFTWSAPATPTTDIVAGVTANVTAVLNLVSTANTPTQGAISTAVASADKVTASTSSEHM
jgi:hypothetical protein